MYKKKINKLVLGTNNQGKVEKLRGYCQANVKIDTPKRLKIKESKETWILLFRKFIN